MVFKKQVHKLIFLYILFAILATFTNIAFQKLSLHFYSNTYSLYVAMIVGTGAGLVLKYILDKVYIFSYVTKNLSHDFVKFLLYSLMGVLTTIIFWGFEILFDYLFPYENAKFVGAIIGLTIGYTTKFFLDRRFVFKNES